LASNVDPLFELERFLVSFGTTYSSPPRQSPLPFENGTDALTALSATRTHH